MEVLITEIMGSRCPIEPQVKRGSIDNNKKLSQVRSIKKLKAFVVF